MALPASIPIRQTIEKTGKQVFRYRGKFISEARFNLLNRRLFRSKFISQGAVDKSGTLQARENRLRSQLGAPPRGKIWVEIANKYEERFEQYLR